LEAERTAETAHIFVVVACVADIAFVIDNSGSIRDNDPPGGNNWKLILDFVKSIIDVFDVAQDGARFAVIDFGKNSRENSRNNFSRRLTCYVQKNKHV